MERLFGGVEENRLTSIRLEFIKGSRHIRMERDAGRWFLTDPMAWPVERGVLDKFLGVIARNGADPVSDSLAAQVSASFAPPLGFIETTETLEDGSDRTVRVEVGALDIDGMRIFVRRDGRVFRTIRNIENLFDFIVPDYRSKRLFALERGSVARVDRSVAGTMAAEYQALDMAAEGAGDRWQLSSPSLRWRPGGLHRLDVLPVRDEGEEVRERRPEPDLARFGLDQPWVTLRDHERPGPDAIAARGCEGWQGLRPAGRAADHLRTGRRDRAVRVRARRVLHRAANFMRLARSRIAAVRIQGGAGDLRLMPGGRWLDGLGGAGA